MQQGLVIAHTPCHGQTRSWCAAVVVRAAAPDQGTSRGCSTASHHCWTARCATGQQVPGAVVRISSRFMIIIAGNGWQVSPQSRWQRSFQSHQASSMVPCTHAMVPFGVSLPRNTPTGCCALPPLPNCLGRVGFDVIQQITTKPAVCPPNPDTANRQSTTANFQLAQAIHVLMVN